MKPDTWRDSRIMRQQRLADNFRGWQLVALLAIAAETRMMAFAALGQHKPPQLWHLISRKAQQAASTHQ